MESVEDVDNLFSSIQANLHIDYNEDPGDLLRKLQLLHCPFTWDVPDNTIDVKGALESAESKEKCMISISSPLIRCFEYAKSGNLSGALEVLQGWNLDQQLNVLLSSDECSDELEEQVASEDNLRKLPYYHVFYSCECFLFYKLKRFEESKEMLKRIVSFENLSSEDQASVYYLRSEVIKEYGHAGKKQAIKILEDALNLYPKSLALQRLLGKLLGRVRRIEDRCAVPDIREMKALEDVLRESYDHLTAVHLALAYREYARNLNRSNNRYEKGTVQLIEDMNRKAADIYSKGYDNRSDNYFLLTRVAEGFIRLPPPWRDLEKAWVCLREALEICKDDPYLNHIAGTFFTLKGDLDEAKFFLNLSSNGMTTNFGACIDLILIKQSLDPQYTPIADMESLLRHISTKPHIEDILCNLGAFVYIEKEDFEKAFEYWSQVIQQNIHSKRLKDLFCRIIKNPQSMSINRIIVHELQKKIGENTCTDKEKAILEKLLSLYPNLKESRFERNRFGAKMSSNSSQSRRWNSSLDGHSAANKEGSWRRKEPLPPVEDCGVGNSGSKVPDSNFSLSSNSSNWRRRHCSTGDTSQDSAKLERTTYYRPGSRFGRISEKEHSWRATSHSDSASMDRPVSKGSFWSHEKASSRPLDTENWRSRPAKLAEDTGK